jgi:hypothetical protein
MIVLIIITGILLWVPALFLIYVLDGPWFSNGFDVLAAISPVLALLVPGLLRPQGSGGTIAALSVALAPLLLILGTLAQIFVTIAMNGGEYSKFFKNASSLTVFACCIVIGLLIYHVLKPSPIFGNLDESA